MAGAGESYLDGYGTNESVEIISNSINQNNNEPTGVPKLSGGFKTGQVVNIQFEHLRDSDEPSGIIHDPLVVWEISRDRGSSWQRLNTTDATDGNNQLLLTSDLDSKHIRGGVEYVDSKGHSEKVFSELSLIYSEVSDQSLVFGSAFYKAIHLDHSF